MTRHSRVLLLVVTVVGLAAALGVTAGAGTSAKDDVTAREATQARAAVARRARIAARTGRVLVRKIHVKRDETWSWQRVMGLPRSPYAGTAEKGGNNAYRRWVLRLWTVRAKEVGLQARRPPHYREWMCIHRYEGAWDDPNAPYWGGLQMNETFMSTYAPELLREKGTADHWTPLEQMWAAEKAHASGRGFYPWPNTARFCGLL